MPFINDFQEKIWRDKYQYGDETYEGFCERLAYTIFSDDKVKGEKLKASVMDFRTLFGGRINSNIGTPEGGLTLFNCFIEPISEEPDSLEGILKILSNYALTLKSEGGVGFCANFFRPAKTLIRKIGVTSPGSVKFLELFNTASEVITSGSVDKEDSFQGIPTKNSIRKGATMVTMSACHPDIFEFITAKSIPNKLTKMNLSVLITDAFMYAVDNDLDWDLWFPDINYEGYDKEWDGNFEKWAEKGLPTVVYKTIKAMELWELLLKSSHFRNEPGILFIDTIRRMDNINYLESSICATNPCQPSWATVLTKNGISTVGDIDVGSAIWSENGWVEVISKINSGVKDINKYSTVAGNFYGTENHKVKSNNVKIEVKDALSIDILRGPYSEGIPSDLISIMDGLVMGDGSVHKASNNLIYLCIGEDDGDYFNSEIKDLIVRHRPGLKKYAWEIKTTLTHSEVPLTYERKIPDRYKFANNNKVASFLRGLYSANGSVLYKSTGKRVTLKASSYNLVEDVQLMLSSLGIKSYITTNESSKGQFRNGEYVCKESYDVNITKDTVLFEKTIGFIHKYKSDRLFEINKRNFSNRDKIAFDIKDAKYVSTEEVFDITVSGPSHTYWSGGLNVSNCGEVVGNTGKITHKGKEYDLGDVCDLGSLNLTKYYDMELEVFNKEMFVEDVELMVEALDNVIDVSKYPLDIYEYGAKMKRKIGLGICGLASLFMMMGVRYGDEFSIKFTEELLKLMMNTAYKTSALLAKEKGSFELYSDELPQTGYVKHSGILDKDVLDLIDKYGLRNSALSAIAPTGSLAILAGNVSGGLEPVFMKEFVRWNRVEGKKVDFKYPNVHKGEWFETDYLKEMLIADEVVLMSTDNHYRIDKNQGLCEEVTISDYGYTVGKAHGKTEFTTTTELTVQEHLNILSVFSKYVDLSSSKTINLPADITFEEFKALYGRIHDYGVKGCTTYRDGTSVAVLEAKREEKVQSVEEKHEEFLDAFKGHENGDIFHEVVKLPEEFPSKGYIIRGNGAKWYLSVAFKNREMTKPFAIFVNTNNPSPTPITMNAIDQLKILAECVGLGGEKLSEVEHKFANQKNPVKIARMLGMMLRHNIPIVSIVKALDKVEDAHPGTFVFRIKKFLCQFIIEPTAGLDMVCPECGSKNIILQEGCGKCLDCDYSKCE